MFDAALAAEECQHTVFVGPADIVAEVRAKRLVLLCRSVVLGEARDRLERGLELELRTHSLLPAPDDDLDDLDLDDEDNEL